MKMRMMMCLPSLIASWKKALWIAMTMNTNKLSEMMMKVRQMGRPRYQSPRFHSQSPSS